MDILPLLDRCIGLERSAGEVYRTLARRTRGDAELAAFWDGMASDEDGHARALADCREHVVRAAREHPPRADGFADDVAELEDVVAAARVRAATADSPDEGFAIALALEGSELDAVYGTLTRALRSSGAPYDAAASRRGQAAHHDTLVAMVLARAADADNVNAAKLLRTADRLTS
jgi:rubrerythrin